MKLVINGRFLTQRISGVQRYGREFVTALDAMLDRGELDPDHWDVTVLAPRAIREPQLTLRRVRLQTVGRLSGHAWEQTELPLHARGDVLFCPGNTPPIASLIGPMRTVVTVHDLSFRYFPDAYSRPFRAAYSVLMPLVMSKADAVVTVSESERSAIIQHYPSAAERLSAVQNGGLPANARPLPASRRTYALYVGTLSKRKNFTGILNAAIRLNRERDLPFVIVGGVGPSYSAAQADVPAELRDRIRLVGQVDDLEQIVRYMSEAICLVFPSFYEASPLPPIEAMACGCPVVASPIPSLKERCGDAALYCDPDSEASIAAAVGRLADDAALHASLQQKGYERAQLFTWENCVRQTLVIVEQVAR